MRRAVLLWVFAALASGIRADDVEVTASLQPDRRVPVDQSVRLVIQVSGTFGDDIDAPRVSGLKNLRIVSGPSTSRSSRFEFVNGRARSSVEASFVYTLLPLAVGTAQVPSLEVKVGDAVRHTEPLSIQVVAAGTPGLPPGSRTGPDQTEAAGQDDIFLRAELSQGEVWVGEAVSMDLRLYAARQFDWRGLVQQPDLKGVWSEDVDVDSNAEAFRTSVDGRSYQVFPVLRKILVPTSAGAIQVGRWVASVGVVQRTRRSLFDMPGLGMMQEAMIQSPPLALRAKPLPEAGRPEDFGGDVGSFRLEASIDRREAAVNDAVSLKVTVRGEGWLQGTRPPSFQPGDGFKVFDATSTGSSDVRNGKLASEKTWEWVLVPLVPVDVSLPEIRFSYFDPKAGEYRTVSARPGDLTVRRSEASPDNATARSVVVPERRDLRFLKSRDGALSRGEARWHRQEWFPVVLALPWILLPAWVFASRRRARMRGDRGRLRASRAMKRARRTLAAARRTPDDGAGSFHETVARGLVEYVADRHDRSAAGLTYDLAEQLLAADGRSPELRSRFRTLLERCDFARYVPGTGESSSRDEVLREAEAVLEALEARQ